MPAFAATAPGKIILFGEHAVVYGRPAIAVPVTHVRARVVASADLAAPAGQVRLIAKDIGLEASLDSLPEDHPLALAVRAVAEQLGIERLPALRLCIASTIPIASGLGSGAAVTVALARALSALLGRSLSDEQVSAIAYRVDQRYHGNPSGIDNTVITYAQPVFYIRGQPFERLTPVQPFTIVIGNTGVPSQTGEVVGDLRRRREADPQWHDRCFDQIGEIARQAREKIEHGPVEDMGPLMNENQRLLRQLDVSSLELDRLAEAALAAGATGAKLCGAGRGGNMIALAAPEAAPKVAEALRRAGAVNTIITTVGNP
jgi:mevalonate kinase